MATDYTDRKATLDEIANRKLANKRRVASAIAQINVAVNDLTAMQTAYSDVIAEINADRTAFPDDLAFQQQYREKEKLKDNFLAEKAYAESIKAAIDAVV